MLKKENPWTSLLAAGLHASADDLADGTLDAKTLVRLVDRRVRGLQSEASQKLDHWVSAAARTSLNQSSDSGRTHGLASFAELTQRWPVLHGPPGLGAFKLAPGQAPEFGQLRSSLQQAAEQVRRSASSSTLGRTLARTMSGRDLARSPGGASAEWDLFKSLDSNLKHLERALRESTAKQRRQALSLRRRRRDGDDTVRRCPAAGRAQPVCPRGVAVTRTRLDTRRLCALLPSHARHCVATDCLARAASLAG
jgi:hypothetical protein